MEMKKKIAVIGAGPGGLSAGMILAHRGFDVTIFEKEATVGGRNAPVKIGDFRFDTGPTFLMMKFILDEMFEEIGKKSKDYMDFYRLDPMYRLKFDDKEVLPTDNHEKMEKEIDAKFPGSGKHFKRFMKKEKVRYEKMFPCLQVDYSGTFSFLKPKLLNALPFLGLGESIWNNLGKYFKQDKLKLSFTFQSKYLGMSAWECPAAFTIVPYIEHAFGIYHVKGGLNMISQGMAKAFAEEGGKLRLSTPVKRILTEGKKAKGVELANGEKFEADEVVVNADFSYSVTELFEKGLIKKYTKDNLIKRKYSCSIFMMYLAVDKVYNIPHHNVFFAPDYKQNVKDIFVNLKLSDDLSFYIQNASVTDPTVAPAGKSTIYVLVPVPNLKGKIDWKSETPKLREKVLGLIEKRTELKDIRQHIVGEKINTAENWRDDYNVFLGATFNLGHNLSQMLFMRPHNRFEEVENVYLTGGGTHPGSGLPTIYESGRISCNLICKKYGVPFNDPTSMDRKHI